MSLSRINILRGMAGLPLGMPIRQDPEDVFSSVPFLPPEIPPGFYEEMANLAAGRWGKAENFVPGMALPTEPELDEEDLDLDLGENISGFI